MKPEKNEITVQSKSSGKKFLKCILTQIIKRHRRIDIAHGRRKGGVVQEHATSRLWPVTHAVGMGVIVVVQGVMMTEGMMHSATVCRSRKAEKVGKVLPSLFHAHRSHEGHSTLKRCRWL